MTDSSATKMHWRFARFFGIAALLLTIVNPIALRLLRANPEDFGYFYAAAAAMRHGENIYRASDGNYIYPPLLAFVLQPLTFFPERAALAIWLTMSGASAIAAVLVAAHETARRWLCDEGKIHRDHVWTIAGIALFLNADKLHKVFGLAQTDSLILLAFALILRWMNRRPLLAGIAIGASANIKYLTLVFVPYFILKRNFRAAFSAIISFVIFLLLPAIEIGFARALDYAAGAFGALASMIGLTSAKQDAHIFSVTWHRSVSITSAIFRWTRFHASGNAVAISLTLLVFLAVMTAIVITARSSGIRLFHRAVPDSERLVSLEWAVLIFLALAFSPQTSSRHMILNLLVYTVATAVFFATKDTSSRFLLASTGMLLAASLVFPLGGVAVHALEKWRALGGASWCALLFVLALVWAAGRALKNSPPNEFSLR